MGADFETLRQLEAELLRPEVRKDRGRLGALLTDDFCEVGASGRVFSKAGIIAALAEEPGADGVTAIEDFAAAPVADGVALVTYRSVRRDATGRLEREVLRSSMWMRVEGKWRMRFHQGTAMPGR